MPEATLSSDRQASPERPSLKPLNNLFVLVHPSFLINNSTHPDSRTFGAGYQEQTRKLQDNAQKRFIPQSETDVLLFIPAHEPKLQDWRRSKEGKKEDPTRKDWTDLYTAIKRGTEFPNNVMTTGNLAYEFLQWKAERVQQVKEDTRQKVIQRLEDGGFEIVPDTAITVAGEYLDLCVSETIDKLFLLPEVNNLRVPKDTTFVSAYGVERFVEGGKTTISGKHIDIFKDMYSEDYQFTEDDEYFYIARTQ